MAISGKISSGIAGAISGYLAGGNDFSPAAIEGNVIWLDSADTSTITLPSGDVSLWKDKSGKVNNATEATNKPVSGSSTLNSRNILDYNGTDDLLTVAASTSINNLFATGGTVVNVVVPDSDGENDFGRIHDKASAGGHRFFLEDESAGFCRLSFNHDFSGTRGEWTTSTRSIKIGAGSVVTVTYDKSSAANVPILRVNGAAQTLTVTTTPVGTADDDSGSAVVLGNSSAGSRTFDGGFSDVEWFNRILTANEIQLVELNLANKYGTYNANAPWILSYGAIQQTAIHNGQHTEASAAAQLANLYGLLGNSNTNGHNDHPLISNTLPHLKSTVSGVITWNWSGTGSAGALETLEAGVNNKGSTNLQFGQEMNFAHFMAGNNGQTQYIVKSAIPSAHVANDSVLDKSFHPTDGLFYGYTRARMQAAAEAMAAIGVIPVLGGYMVFLGGSDRTFNRAPAFEENFQSLVDALLDDDMAIGLTTNRNTPMLAPSLVDYATPGVYAPVVQAGIDAVAAANANVTPLDVLYAEVGSDGEHLTERGMADMGEQYAEFFTTIAEYGTTESRIQNIDARASVTKDGSNLVSSHIDSDNSIDWVAAGAARPTWVDNQMNGNPIIRYSGAEFLNGGQEAILDLVGGTDAYTIISIVNSIDTGTIISKAQATTAGRQAQHYIESGSNDLGTVVSGDFTNFTDLVRVTSTPYMFATSTNVSANSVRGQEGDTQSTVKSGDPGIATDTADWLIGARRNSDSNTGTAFLATMDLAQILIFEGQLTPRMLSKMKAWREVDWGTL